MKTNTPNENINQSAARPMKPRRRNFLGPALIILVLLFAGIAAYFYSQYSALKADPAKDAKAEVESIVAEVSKLIVLPDEQPTIATVTDVEKLKDQAFFAKAKNGDKVLIYTEAKKAILYDPVNKKIVEVAPINIGNSTGATPRAQTQTSVTTTPTPAAN